MVKASCTTLNDHNEVKNQFRFQVFDSISLKNKALKILILFAIHEAKWGLFNVEYTDTGTQNSCLLHKPYWNKGIFTGDKCLKSAIRLLKRVCVGQQGLDLSKEVLWVSVCQRAAKLPAGKVGGLKKNSTMRPGAGESVSNLAAWQNIFQTSNFASW